MTDNTYHPAQRRKVASQTFHQDLPSPSTRYPQDPFLPTQRPPSPPDPPHQPRPTKEHNVPPPGAVISMLYLEGTANGRAIRHTFAEGTWEPSLPSPPSEDGPSGLFSPMSASSFPPAAIAMPPPALLCTSASLSVQPAVSCDDYNNPLPPEPSSTLLWHANPAPRGVTPWLLAPQAKRRKPCGSVNMPIRTSPFKDCLGEFGNRNHHSFARPPDGQVNGYIKFNWPRGKQGRRASVQGLVSGQASVPTIVSAACDRLPSSMVRSASISELSTISDLFSQTERGVDMIHPKDPRNKQLTAGYRANLALARPNASLETVDVPMGSPQMLPELFGYDAKMDAADRKLWTFYTKNWCPGRSVLLETNLWLKDFAPMHKSDGVRAAIQSLAGIYIYDYLPSDEVKTRVNQRFSEAESCYSSLLADPSTAQNVVRASEAITIGAILSMQDIVLTERRLKWPRKPRWLSGFQQGEFFLEATDQALRHWERSEIQLSSLCISQSVIVGRALILAQPMAPLPEMPDPQVEACRFGWLLYGSQQDLLEIHGGCGFSRKLLHLMSQITYCAARLQQDPGNIVVPITAQFLLRELLQMRQWSRESEDWEAAKAGCSVSEHLRGAPEGYKIDSSADMTVVTAEVWRLAAIIYLKCRVLRLPRSHPDVVPTLSDLAACIRAMPTSGFQFTAQAPLFPVFLLGLLATSPGHKTVSKNWFNEVVSTPVRSSVPPLYQALQRIWQWIHLEIELLPGGDVDILPIGKRPPWWERLVEEITEHEEEMLCLT